MTNHIKKIHLKDLFDLFEQDTHRLDIILCREASLLDEVQSLLEDETSLILITLEQDDLYDQKSILNGLHTIFFDEEFSEQGDPQDIIESLEDELGELKSCLLIVEDFSSCSIEAQAALLELVMMSRAFKLLLKVEDNSVLSVNENLWDVLASRSGFLEKDNNFFAEDFKDQESNFQEDYEEDDEINDEIDEEYSVKTNRSKSDLNSNKKPVWYQILPKYHIAGALVLIIVVFALWDRDKNQNKEENIKLQLDDNISENHNENSISELAINESEISNHNTESLSDELSVNNQTQVAVDLGSDTETIAINNSENIESIDLVKATTKETQQPVNTQSPKQSALEKAESAAKVAETKVSNAAPLVQAPKNTNWSPYQSDKWINGVNKKYYTLQLLASHDEQGIRNFLKEHGINSQYSVYTTKKNNKPWHVIIYGVYQTHELADKARKDLPDYLKSYSPWIRSFADVQKTLQ